MALNDVWRNLDREIGVVYRGRFENVPHEPGVYAWFYPLKITTDDIEE